MADLSNPPEPATPATPTNHLLLPPHPGWWARGETASCADPELGYESALPWTLGATLGTITQD